MEDRDSKISVAQFFALGVMIGNALFVGMGNIILVQIVKENTWLNAIIGLVLGILPILLLVKIMNYQPSLNLIDKITTLFPPVISHIINFLLFLFVTFILIITIWSATDFALTKYLSETPFVFITFLFIIAAIYAVTKGIETICRSNQFLFIISLFVISIITISLSQYMDFRNVKPILADGIKPLFEGVPKFIAYCYTPFITLLMIPKDKIDNPQKVGRYLVLGYICSATLMVIIFFVIMSSLGVEIASLYRYPAYYVMKKVTIANAIDKVENFLTVHWVFNLFSVHMLGLYYSTSYLTTIFKIKNNKIKNILIIVTGIIIVFIVDKIFPSSTWSRHFMNKYFPWFISLPLLGLIILISIKTFFPKKKQLKIEQSN